MSYQEEPEKQKIINQKFKKITGDVFKLLGDALIIIASKDLNHPVGTGLDRLVYEKAGREELIREREKAILKAGYTQLRYGDVFITPACKLIGYKYIIHVIAKRRTLENYSTADDFLLNCYCNAINLAVSNGCKRIVSPVLATGNLGFPEAISKKLAKEAVYKAADKDFHLDLVSFNNVKDTQRDISKLKGYSSLKEQFQLIKQSNHNYSLEQLESMFVECSYMFGFSEEECWTAAENELGLNNDDESFSSLLRKYQKGISNSELARRSGITPGTISRLASEKTDPTRATCIRLAIGLKLNSKDADEFIRYGKGSQGFPKKKDPVELYIASCIDRQIYDIHEIEAYLEENHPDCEFLKASKSKKHSDSNDDYTDRDGR